MSGAEAVQAARMGTYTRMPNVTQGDRPVYQRVGSTVAYLFYWPSTSDWRIGSSYTTGSSGVKSTGGAGAACPDQATDWQAYTGGVWVDTYPITVAPAATPTAASPISTPTNAGSASTTPACGLPRGTLGVLPHMRAPTAPPRPCVPSAAYTVDEPRTPSVYDVNSC